MFAKTDYAFAIGDGLQVADAGIIPNDIDGDKMITAFDVQYPEEGIPFENIRTVKPRMMNVGVGLTWHFSTAQSQTKKVSVRGWDTKHKSQFNAPLSDNYSQDDELQRKLPIREGGRTVEAGNIPESQQAFDDVTWSTTLSDNTEMPPRDIDKPFLMTKDELVDVIANEAKLTKVDAGNALNALYKSLSTLLNNEESIQLIHFEENKNTSEASDERVADLKKLADELVNLVADEAKLTKADAGNALNSFLSNLDKTLKENNLVSPESNSKLIVPVALNKGLRFEIDKDLSGNGLTYTVLSVKADDKDLDSDGYADVARGIEKSDIRRGMVIAKPSPSRVAANNPNTEETTKRLATGDLKSLYPPENKKKSSSYFKKIDDIEYFVWEYIGKEIPNANYIIELTKIGDNGQAQQIFIGQIAENADKNQPNGKEINSANKKVAKFKAGKTLADVVKRTGNPNQGDEETMTDDGLYTWKVIETTTGISSEPSFFTVSKKFSDVHGYNENSAMLVVKIDQTLLRNTNTVITSENKELLDKRHDRMGIRALRIHDYRHGIRARHHDERIKTARSNDARIKTLRSNDERIKSARTNDARIKTARTNDARIKDARVSARADKRHDDALRANSNFSDQPIEIITDENFKVPPQTNIDTKYLRIKNQQSVQIDKGPLQLIAPLLSAQNNDKSVTYSWIITNKDENTTNSFNGSSIVHDFSLTGTYEIEITPALNGQKRKPYRVIFVVK
ncbi:HU family DNA-binding protein [Mangrovibacterium sp.]|uniref:HU family DNA-binding protein n=1 Tax=Mangrovibacterium sp. TaxID=1961364 RepID=UPI003566A4A6